MDWSAYYQHESGMRHWPCEELVRFVGRRREQVAGQRVVEAGCGNGSNLWFLAEHAKTVFGVDGSAVAIALARHYCEQRGKANVLLEVGDVRSLPYATAAMDVVVDCMVSQHIAWAEHMKVYREYRRVLKRGGFVFVYHLDDRTTGTRHNEGFDHDGVPVFPDVGLTCCPHTSQLAYAVEAAGFHIREMRGLEREYPGGQVAHYAIIDAEAA